MFNLANLISGLNLLCGFCSIVAALLGRIDLAVFLIFLGATFDFLDGFVARKLNIHSEMGKQLDSLADIVTFGVAPGVFMMVVLMIDVNAYLNNPYYEVIRYDFVNEMEMIFDGSSTYYLPFIALLIPFFSLFRLAKFNIDKRQSDKFIGLPTPANTLFFSGFPLAITHPEFVPDFLRDYTLLFCNPYLLSGLIVVFSMLLVAELPLFALKFKHFSWNGNEIRYVFLLISLIIIVAFRTWSVSIIVFLYLILSLIQNSISKQQGNEIQSGN